MRLTLRTLLAWLDDTLKPTQVREIGIQVSGSPFAQELSDRIHRVTRQRRLSVPSSSGPEATDPNIVACYLDNELDPDAVAEYEKKCLTSDVNLAEVASVHQILSLLGQKVKVPAEARTRMYQLVKGREAHRPKKVVTRRVEAPEPVTRPIQHWVVPEAPRRPWIERFGPALACLLLIGLASLTAWRSVTAPVPEAYRMPHPGELTGKNLPAAKNEPQPETVAPPSVAAVDPAVAAGAVAGSEAVAGRATAGAGEAAKTPAKSEENDPSKAAKVSDSSSKSKDGSAIPPAPVGTVGLAAASDGVLLRFNADDRAWVGLKTPAPLAASSRLLSLAPFGATITLGKTELALVDETELRILPQSSDDVPGVELIQGRLVVKQHPTGPLKLAIKDRIVTVDMESNDDVAVEKIARWEYGRMMNPAPKLVIYCLKGQISVSVDKKKETLSSLETLAVDAAGVTKRTSEDAIPAWASNTSPSPRELQIREQFAKMLHPGKEVLRDIVLACDDQSPQIRLLSIQALKALGDMSYLMPLLSRQDDPQVRRASIAAIRSYMALSPEAAGRVRDELIREFGEDTASTVGKMLMGFSPPEASSPEVFEQLVGLLAPEQVHGVRELALDNLKRLTARDDLGYDPDHPEGKGLTAWKELQRQGKLRVSTPRPKSQ
jgi:hypothetical protein